MNDDPKCASGTQNGIPTSRKAARIPSTPKVEDTGSAILNAKPRAVGFRDTKEFRILPEFLKSPGADRASTSSTPKRTLRCPVTGKPIPELEEIEKKIEKNLTLWNWRWPRSIAVKGIALALQQWALEVGLERAARRGEVLLSNSRPLEYADLKNLPWIPEKDIEKLTPEAFADRLGGIVDELERTAGAGDEQSNQRLLPSDRTSPSGDRAGGDSGDGGSDGDGDADRPGRTGEGGDVITFPSRRTGRSGKREGLHRSHVVLELEEHGKDLSAFLLAHACIWKRVQEVKDDGRLMKLVEWSGTSAVLGTLDLSIHAIERVVEELRDVLRRIDSGVIPNLDED